MSKKSVTMTITKAEQAKFNKWVDKLSHDNNKACRTLIVGATLKTARLAMTFAPVNFGFLRSSIRPKFTKGSMEGEVYVTKNYAPYQEFGTGNKVFTQYGMSYVPDKDVKEYASQFRGSGKRNHNMASQPFLFPAFRLVVREMIEKLKQMGYKPVK